MKIIYLECTLAYMVRTGKDPDVYVKQGVIKEVDKIRYLVICQS